MRAILTYHSIDSSGSPISVSEAAFTAHCRFLGSGRVTVLPLAELLTRTGDDDAVAITFDDGFRNFATLAWPRLIEHRLPATVFIPSDYVGGTNAWGGLRSDGVPELELMAWEQLGQVAKAGFEIGAHTRHHPDLTRLPAARIEDECAGCVTRIATELGVQATSFAYPYGLVNETVARVARKVFARSCTTEFRPLAPVEDAALIPRLDAWYFRDAGQIERWGTQWFRRRLWLRARGREVRGVLDAVTGLVRGNA
jgi:peptidoglycan/xylan/chitin deacetylase (PgdA/CDA1 family)